ncbi:MAG: CBS domain-containing protein [Gemmatimonadota bacterium]|nr:CBS domain-containing protein [Candidatus Palauibacterales bacterium]
MDNSFGLDELVNSDRIVVGLEVQGFKDAVGLLLDRLEAAGVLADRGVVEAAVDAEIGAGELPTVGDSALLAHYRTDAVRDLALAIGTSRQPFSFAPDRAPGARILLLVVAPRSAARYYLKVLGGLRQLLRDPEVTEQIANAASPEALLKVAGLENVSIRPELLVQDLMSRSINSVSPDSPLSEVLHVMVRHRRRAVPVVSETGEVLGMVTERELLQHFLPQLSGGTGLQPGRAQVEDIEVREVMERSVMCLSEDQLVSDVAGTMGTKGVARFPVVRDGKLVGFLSRTDIIRKLLDISV